MNLIYFAADHLVELSPLPQPAANQDTLVTGLNIAFSIIGAVAVMVIVLAGMRHVFARDNAESITKSRNTVLYAVIGLVITVSAAAVVNLVIARLGK